MAHRLPKKISNELNGKPWRMEDGGKHFKYFIDGRFAFVWPKNGGSEGSPNAIRNTVAQIRRAAQGC
jgi:hypothetical protein